MTFVNECFLLRKLQDNIINNYIPFSFLNKIHTDWQNILVPYKQICLVYNIQ